MVFCPEEDLGHRAKTGSLGQRWKVKEVSEAFFIFLKIQEERGWGDLIMENKKKKLW